MNRRDLGPLRAVPLEAILQLRGAVRDRRDKSKWHTEQGPLSVTGCQFMNWQQNFGGGGAIDLVMHLAGLDYGDAVQWLQWHAGRYTAATDGAPRTSTTRPADALSGNHGNHSLRLPMRDDRRLDEVHEYLINRRHLSVTLLNSLLQAGRLYADQRSNAVFVMVRGKPHQPVGAELRGTGPRVWRGMAPGSRKNLGYFWIGDPTARELVLCESAIDAISCFQLRGACICISTAGVRAKPAWLPGLIARGYQIHCGFDTDDPGEAAAAQLIASYPVVQRLRPPAHDWNDVLPARL